MPISELTQLWLEAPLFDEALAAIPDHVIVVTERGDPIDGWPQAYPAQAIVASSRLRYTAAVLAALPNLRIIARTGIGVDNIDLDAATAHGIVVTNTPDGPTESTAEHTVAMLLALAKRLKQGNENLAAGKWGPRSGILVGTEVMDKTLGVLGFGRIGRRVAQICRLGLTMRVLVYDPYVDDATVKEMGCSLAEFDDVIAQADFLSLHMPATPQTRHIIDSARIAQMKDGAYLLNLARGALVDEAALLAALDSGKLAGAGLDVFDGEPPAVDHPLRTHPNVIATPHTASLTWHGRLRMEQMALERLLTFFNDQRPQDVVNPGVFDIPPG